MSKQDQTSADKDFSAQFLASRRARRRRRGIALVVLIAAGGGTWFWMSQQGEAVVADEDLIVTIGRGNIENAIPAAGTLQPKEVVPIGARASGELVEIYVEVGDFVEAGMIVALIDAREQELRVRARELDLQNQINQLEQRELDVRNAERDFERAQMLHEADAFTDQELEGAEITLLQARTNLRNLEISIEQSETSLEQERVQLDYTEIKVPLSGTVITLDQKEGATLNASQTAPTVMQIADLTTLTVETEISEADVQALSAGVEVYFTTLGSGDRRWYGTLRKIDPMGTVSNNVVLFNGSFDVDNSDGELYPNMTTQVFFVTSSAENVLTVPVGALSFKDSPAAGRSMSSRQGPAGNREELTARFEQTRQGGGEITPEMRARFEQMRASGGSQGGDFPGGGSFGDQDSGGSEAVGLNLADSIALNEPRHATVEVVLPNGGREVRDVVVGAMDRVNAEVISGLETGDQVVAGIVLPQAEVGSDDGNNNRNQFRQMRGFF